MQIVPVILSGGGGSRLWPLSRQSLPKQFLELVGDQTLFQMTCQRLKIGEFSAPIVLCNHEHRFLVAEQLHEIGQSSSMIVLEPVARDTAPAALVGALLVANQELANGGDTEEPLILLLPSDHVIPDTEAFVETIKLGAGAAQAGQIVTFGIRPDCPNTGYGYIEIDGSELNEGAYNVLRFVEKPDLEAAERYLSDHNFLWNGGMFLFRPSVLIDQFRAHAPHLLAPCEGAVEHLARDLDFLRLAEEHYAKAEGISLDYAIVEKVNNIVCVPLETPWSDLGSWSSVWQAAEKDAKGNAFHGDVHIIDSEGCYANSTGPSIVLLGTEDAVVVATRDVVLVTNKQNSENVKNAVEQLRAKNRSEITTHTKVYRPWGWYDGLIEDNRYQVKCIMVKPGGVASLQKHFHRAEHWVVVAGTLEVTCDGKDFMLTENQSTYIPIGSTHRMANPGKIPAFLIEVQSGSYLGEDDIIRFEDAYGRIGAGQPGGAS